MQKSLLRALAAASICVSLSAHAVNISSDGTGEALIYPYYNVRNGNTTLISVVNNDPRAKAVKVRFREGRNGVEVLDFNLFLSRSDVWTAALVADASGAAKLITADLSCTNPRIPQAGVPFRNLAYVGDASAVNGLDRTAEGYLEIIEMASIVPNSAIDRDVAAANRTCGLVNNTSIATRSNEFEAPRGKLSGNGTVVSSSMSTGYSALALQGMDFPTRATESGSLEPNLSSGRSKTAVITEATPKRTYMMFAEFDRSIDAVSAALMQNTLGGELSQELGIATDFVMTFPTKHLYVNGSIATQPNNPFRSPWNRDTGKACESYWMGIVTREGESPGEAAYSPAAPIPANANVGLCFSTTTMLFTRRETSSPLGSRLSTYLSTGYATATGITSEYDLSTLAHGTATLRLGDQTDQPRPILQSTANSRLIVTEPGVATREISGPVKFYGLPVIGIGIASAIFANRTDNYNSSYNLMGGRVLPE